MFLNVGDKAGLERACGAILAAGADILVARMIAGSREFMAGMSRHPGFPPCIMFGLGGVFAEAVKDFTIRLAPLSPADALEMTGSLRAGALLGPFRGMGEADRGSLASLLVGLGNLALDFPSIKEIDLNPIIIENGRPCVADALMVTEQEERDGQQDT